MTRNILTDGEHWTTVRELWMRKDKERCERWYDQVQNILIFSGLFSAIVTAFLIESQKDLNQLDPVEVDPITIWVNVLWFLSLVFSLTSALVGIVSLQWVRSHLHSLGDGADSLGISYMHSLGLRQSYVPVAFTSLPIILIFGLTFFLIGIILFLFKLNWIVAIPVTFAIAITFAFLVITTALPALQSSPAAPQSSPVKLSKGKSESFPSPYRSAQSRLFLHPMHWGTRSEIWLLQRTKDSLDKMKVLSHLESIPEGFKSPFQYDTLNALLSLKESRSAESEKERIALAKCLAAVLPLHLNFFPTGDLAEVLPFLSRTAYVPSAALHQDSATHEDRSAMALLLIATCNGVPSQNAGIVAACLRISRLLFEQPLILDSYSAPQPLELISKPDEIIPEALEVLIDSLTHFFTTDFKADSLVLYKTTHASPYTYWFLARSAKILTHCQLSEELQARHAYILHMITVRLDKQKADEYLFYTASIYASILSEHPSPAMRSSPFWANFLRAVKVRRGSPGDKPSQLCRALKADEVRWVNIDRALEALRHSNDTTVAHHPLSCAYSQDSTLSEAKESDGQIQNVDSSRMAAFSVGPMIGSDAHEEKIEICIGQPPSS